MLVWYAGDFTYLSWATLIYTPAMSNQNETGALSASQWEPGQDLFRQQWLHVLGQQLFLIWGCIPHSVLCLCQVVQGFSTTYWVKMYRGFLCCVLFCCWFCFVLRFLTFWQKKKVQKFGRGKVRSTPYLQCRIGSSWTVKAWFWTQWSGLCLKTWHHQLAVPWSLQGRSSWYQQVGIITTAFSENFNTHSSSSTAQRSSFIWNLVAKHPNIF